MLKHAYEMGRMADVPEPPALPLFMLEVRPSNRRSMRWSESSRGSHSADVHDYLFHCQVQVCQQSIFTPHFLCF